MHVKYSVLCFDCIQHILTNIVGHLGIPYIEKIAEVIYYSKHIQRPTTSTVSRANAPPLAKSEQRSCLHNKKIADCLNSSEQLRGNFNFREHRENRTPTEQTKCHDVLS